MAQSWTPQPLPTEPALTPVQELAQLLRHDAWGSATLTSADQKALKHES